MAKSLIRVFDCSEPLEDFVYVGGTFEKSFSDIIKIKNITYQLDMLPNQWIVKWNVNDESGFGN